MRVRVGVGVSKGMSVSVDARSSRSGGRSEGLGMIRRMDGWECENGFE